MMRPAHINCGTCGVLVSVSPTGRIPGFCGAKCRKASYGKTCIDCGKRTDGSDGYEGAPERCRACTDEHGKANTRRWILDSFREWYALFGRQPVVQEWSAAHARLRGRYDLIAQLEATGRPWPSPESVKDHFGSWSAGVAAAGFTPLARGERRDPEAHRASLRVARGTRQRRERIAAMFVEGLTYAQIGERMGVTKPTIGSHLQAMRAEGWDLPYRNPPRQKATA